MEATNARVGAYGSRSFAIEGLRLPMILAMCALPTFGPSLADFCNDAGAGVPPTEKMMGGVHEHGGVLYHVWVPLEVAATGTPRVYHLVTALVPRPGGAVVLEAALSFSPVATEPGMAERMAFTLTWMASGTADASPVLKTAIEWCAESFGTELTELDDPLPLDDELCDALLRAGRRTVSLGTQLQAAQTSLANGLREQANEHQRVERRLTRQVQELRTELDTARAVALRQRARADKVEREARQTAAAALAGDSNDAVVAQLRARLAEREAASALLEHERDQYSAEVDRLRADIYRLRDQLAYRAPTPPPAAPEVVDDCVFPSDLASLGSWSEQVLAGRVVVHPKAARAARKSNYSDPPRLYRVLQAMADHYWAMRFDGSAPAREAWTAFLTEERLSCTPTGDAAAHHRTADAYRLKWHGEWVTLDLHIRGDSSRDAARVFRVYFHVDDERKLIVIGHAPGHLPNTLS